MLIAVLAAIAPSGAIASDPGYGGQSDDAALATVSASFGDLIGAPALRWPRVHMDEELQGYLTDNRAVVAQDDGHKGLVESTLPLRGETLDGDTAPIDLALMDADSSSFAPRSSAAATRIPDSASGELRFPDQSFGVALAGAEQKDAVVQSNTTFYPNVVDDGDMVIEPRPDGAELSVVLRSQDSPTAIPLAFDLGADQTLRTVTDDDAQAPPGSLEVVGADGAPVAAAYPPAAVDAAGAGVPVHYERSGDRVTMEVDTSGDPQWPVLVDPIIGVYDSNGTGTSDPDGTTWPNWKPGTTSEAPGTASPTSWSYCNNYSGFPNRKFYFCKGSLSGTSFDPGAIYVKANPNGTIPYLASDWGEWAKKARVETVNGVQQSYTYIYQFDVSAMSNSGENHEQTAVGIQKADGTWENGTVYWGNGTQSTGVAPAGKAAYETAVGTSLSNVTRYVKAGNGQPTPALTPGNSAIIKMDMTAGQIGANLPYVAVGGGATYSSEVSPPWFSSLNHTKSSDPTLWYKSFTDTVSGGVGDHGLGMGKVTFAKPGVADTTLAADCPVNGAPDNTSSAGASGAYDSCSLSLAIPNTTYTTAQQGVNRYSLTATDLVGNQTTTPWQVNLDNTGPQFDTPTGSLWDAQNQMGDHRREGLYDPSYTVTVHAVDGSTTNDSTKRSGVHDIRFQLISSSGAVVADSLDGTPQSCPQWNCDKSRPWTLNTDSYPDGDYTVKVIATDVAGNASNITWPVTIDRQGDIYTAAVYDGVPSAGGALVATENAQINTLNARRAGDEDVSTRHSVACPGNATQQCGEVRYDLKPTSTDETSDRPGDTYAVYTGTSVTDSRLESIASILEPANTSLGAATATGPITDQLQAWQTAPPGHGSSYAMYETKTSNTTDGASSDDTRRLYIDQLTKMPLKQTTISSGGTQRDVYYSYDRNRLTTAQVPGDEFALTPPANPSSTISRNLANVPADSPLDDDSGLTQEAIDEATDFRAQYGFNTDSAYVAASFSDPTFQASLDDYGVPLSPAEQSEMALRSSLEDEMSYVENYGADHPDTYAGAYIDQAGGGLVYVGFTSAAQTRLQELKATYPHPLRLRSFDASISENALDALYARVRDDYDQLSASGVPVMAVTQNDAANMVDIAVPSPTAALTTQVQARYASANVRVVQGSQQAATDSGFRVDLPIPPLYAGLQIRDPNLERCSTAFSMHKKTANSKTGYRGMTAGHCGPKADVWSHFKEPGSNDTVAIGSVTRRSFHNGARADSELFTLKRPEFATNEVLLAPNSYRTIDSTATFSEGQIKGHGHDGTTVCAVGWREREQRCRPLKKNKTSQGICQEYDQDGNCVLTYRFNDQKEANFLSRPGDSGGAVFRKHKAWGIVISSGNATHRPSVFTPISNILDAWPDFEVVGTE